MVSRLLWLKWRLLWNGLRADRQRRVGLPVAVGLLVAAAWYLADRYLAAASSLGGAAHQELVLWAGLALFVAWVALPVVIFPLDENLDPAQFALVPVTPTALVTGLAASSLVAPSVVALAWLLAANAAVVDGPWVPTALGSLLLLAQLVVGGQLFTTVMSAVLRTRRGRDLAMLVVMAIGLGGFAAQLMVSRTVSRLGLAAALTAYPLSGWGSALPPVAAQRIPLEAAAGRWVAAAGFALVAAAWVGVMGWAWSRLLGWMLTTPTESPRPARRSRGRGLAGSGLWGRAWVLARKELRFYLRDPRQRLVWTGAVIFVGLAAASILVGTGGLTAFRVKEWLPLVAPGLVLFVGLPVALNQFGWERNAASFLFVLPVKPHRLLLGKNLATATALMAETAVMSLLLAWLSGGWAVLHLVPGLTVAAVGCQLAVGNLVSVLTPLRLPREGTDVFSQATEQGCLAIASQVVSFFVIGLLLVLPASVAVLTVSFGQHVPAWFTTGFALLWGVLFYSISLSLSGWLLGRRAPEVVQWVHVV